MWSTCSVTSGAKRSPAKFFSGAAETDTADSVAGLATADPSLGTGNAMP